VELAFGESTITVRGGGEAVLLDSTAPVAREVDWQTLADRAVAALPSVERPCLIVPDRTRPLPLVPALQAVRRALAQHGHDGAPLPVVFASGTHAPMSAPEMASALGGLPASDFLAIAHDCDASPLRPLADGSTRVHEAVATAGAVVALGPLTFHYLAGFGGGRKLLLPGVADRATATAVHRACLRSAPPGRAPGAEPGVLEGNPLHRAIIARLPGLPPMAGVTIVLDGGRLVDGEGGELLEHHARLATRFGAERTVTVDAPLDAAVVSAGGAPFDTNLVQAHKALRAVAPVLREGARVVLVARMERGLGHEGFLPWVQRSSAETLDRLLGSFVIGEQTAWSLRTLLDRFEVGIVSTLDDDLVRALGAVPLATSDVAAFTRARGPVGFAPRGASRLYRLAS